jgi:hypothetical protein
MKVCEKMFAIIELSDIAPLCILLLLTANGFVLCYNARQYTTVQYNTIQKHTSHRITHIAQSNIQHSRKPLIRKIGNFHSLHIAAVSDSHFPCHAHAAPMPCSDHAVFLKATAQQGRRETACGLPARLRLLPATTRSSTKIVIGRVPIPLTTIRTYDCKEWQQHTTKETIC